ncbi:MAG: C-terminal binding protein [Synergistaceae bacterium]|nr:C-terminal binding protein [Synergistaceae bacterium]
MPKPLVVIFSMVCDDGIEEIERPIIEGAGADVRVAESMEELEHLAPEMDAAIVANAILGRDFLSRAVRCKVVVRHGMGVDNLDVKAAAELGIMICNVPDFNLEEVSDHALAYALSLARYMPHYNWTIKREKKWHHMSYPVPQRIGRMRLGIVGFGKIGRLLARKAAPLFGEVAAYDPFMNRSAAADQGVRVYDELDDLLRESDIVSLHVPLCDETYHLIDDRRIRLMKPTAHLINTARGPLVDMEALTAALGEGVIAGAGFDVIEGEFSPDLNHPMFAEKRLSFTPHTAWYSSDSLEKLRTIAAEEVRDVIMGRIPVGRVNGVPIRTVGD